MESNSLRIFLEEEYLPVASKVSAFAAFFIVVFMVGMTIYDYKLVNRVSLRLQIGIALYDIWLHTGFMWRAPFSTWDNPMCTFNAWQRFFFPLFYAFLNVSIGINLQLIFLHNKVITRRIEVLYWLVPITVILLFTVPPLAMGKFGYNKHDGCYIADVEDDIVKRLMDIFTNQLWRLISMIYLIIISVLVIFKLNRGLTFIDIHDLKLDPAVSEQAIKTVKKVAYRILLYPATMLLSHSTGIISQFYLNFTTIPSDFLDNWTIMVYPCAGTLNFIAFCCDPTVHAAIKIIYYRITKKEYKNPRKYENIKIYYTILTGSSLESNDLELKETGTSLENGEDSKDFRFSNMDGQLVSSFIKSL